MKYLGSIENDTVQLEIIECSCGYHMGVDATYLDQVGDFLIVCPACQAVMDTSIITDNVAKDITQMSKETYRCPDGTKTTNVNTYTDEWRKLAEPVCEMLGGTLIAFNPDLLILIDNVAYNISLIIARAIIKQQKDVEELQVKVSQFQRISDWLIEHPAIGETLGAVDKIVIERLKLLEQIQDRFLERE